MAIIGFDDLPVCQCMPVALSSVTFDRKQVAEVAIEAAICLIRGGEYSGIRKIPAQLIVRESSIKTETEKRREK